MKKTAFRTCKIALIIFFVSLHTPLYTQVENDIIYDFISRITAPFFESNENTTLAIGIIHGEYQHNIILNQNSDVLNVNKHSLFEIGSITKIFTTLLLAEQIADNNLSLYTPVNEFLPDHIQIPKYNGKEMTVFHLATHTAGFKRVPSNLFSRNPLRFLIQRNNPYREYTKENLINFLQKFVPKREYGAVYEYSNTGYAVLGYILEKITGKEYKELLKEKLTRMNLIDTKYTLNDEQNAILVNGYNERGKRVLNWDVDVFAPALGLKSSLRDMVNTLEWSMGTINEESGTLFDFCQKEWFTYYDEYGAKRVIGLGWNINYIFNSEHTIDKIIWSGGATGGYRSYIGFIENEKIGVVILANTTKNVDILGQRILTYLNENK